MMTSTKDLCSLEERIHRLERQNRRLWALAILPILVLGPLILMAESSPQPRTIEAESIVLKDSDGKVRARLGTKDHNVRLEFFDQKDVLRLQLGVGDQRTTISLGDAAGRMRGMLGVDKADEAIMGITGEEGHFATALTVSGGIAGLKVNDVKGNLAAGLLTTPAGNALTVSDSAGRPRLAVTVPLTGPGLLVLDESGKATWHAP